MYIAWMDPFMYVHIYIYIYIYDIDACFEFQEKASGMMEKASNEAMLPKVPRDHAKRFNINVLTNLS
jgi:hypothetical protein